MQVDAVKIWLQDFPFYPFFRPFLHAVYSCFVKKRAIFWALWGLFFLKVNIDIMNDRFIVDGCIVL